MRKIATAMVAAALLVTLASPAGASFVPTRERPSRFHECYGHQARGPHRGDCYDEHRPQHDGDGSLLF